MRKHLFLMPAVCMVAACGMSDPLLGSWSGPTDPSQTAASYQFTLNSNKTFEYTFEETVVETHDAAAEELAGCTVTSKYTGSFSDNPYDLGGVLIMSRKTANVAIAGCADAANNQDATDNEDFGGDRVAWLYRIKGKVLQMNVYGKPETPFVDFTRK